MTSFKRILEYTKQTQEPATETQPKYRPIVEWPQEGRIQFSNYSLKYSEDGKTILDDLSFVIQPKVKMNLNVSFMFHGFS